MIQSTLALLLALSLLVGLGWQAARLLHFTRGRPLSETVALAFLLGSGVLTLLIFWLSLLKVSRPFWVAGGLSAGVILAAAAWQSRNFLLRLPVRASPIEKEAQRDWRLDRPNILEGNGNGWHKKQAAQTQVTKSQSRRRFAFALPLNEGWSLPQSLTRFLWLVFGVETAVILWEILTSGLGWDGEFIYALKARIFFVSGGVDLAYFSDLSRQWSHPDYPLLVPLNEAWLFTWLGRVAQGAALKVFFALLFACLLILFYRALRRRFSVLYSLGFSLLVTGLPALLPAVQTGYADLPLSVFALASMAGMYYWLEEGHTDDLLLAGVMAALGAWVKREGMILWGIELAALAAWVLGAGRLSSRRRRLAVLARFVLPGLLLVPWLVFSASAALPDKDFLAVSLPALQNGLTRIPELARQVLGELFSPLSWGLMWALFLIAVLRPSRLTRGEGFLLVSVVSYIFIMSGSFLLSAWQPFTRHVALALERLLLHVAPLALLFVAIRLGDLDQRIKLWSRIPE